MRRAVKWSSAGSVLVVALLGSILALGQRALGERGDERKVERTPEEIRASYEAHQGEFDYLLGDWRFTAESQEYGKHHGHWSAVRLADGQILDEYRVVDEGGETIYMTTTLRAYNAVLDRWELIGTTAGYGLQDTGTARRTGTEMLIEQEFGASSGTPSRWRIRYYDIGEDSFSWAGDRSTDGGETWEKNHLTIEARRIGPARFLGPLAEAKHRRGLLDAPERAVPE